MLFFQAKSYLVLLLLFEAIEEAGDAVGWCISLSLDPLGNDELSRLKAQPSRREDCQQCSQVMKKSNECAVVTTIF